MFFFPQVSSLSFTHPSIRCLRGAFSALLEFVNNQKHRSWLVCRVCVISVGEHAMGTLERDRRCKREKEVDGGEENVRPSCCLVRQWRGIFYSVFPSTGANSLSASSVSRQEKREMLVWEKGDGHSYLKKDWKWWKKNKAHQGDMDLLSFSHMLRTKVQVYCMCTVHYKKSCCFLRAGLVFERRHDLFSKTNKASLILKKQNSNKPNSVTHCHYIFETVIF